MKIFGIACVVLGVLVVEAQNSLVAAGMCLVLIGEELCRRLKNEND